MRVLSASVSSSVSFSMMIFSSSIFLFVIDRMPNKSPEPTAVGVVSSAVAVHVVGRRRLSFYVRHRGGAAFFAQDLAGVGHLDIAQRVFVVAQFAFLQDCVRWYSEQRDFESFALDDSMIF